MEELAKICPFLNLDDIQAGSFNTQDEGAFDAWEMVQSLRRISRENGAEYIDNEVVAMTMADNEIQDVVLKTGERIRAGKVVNAAGTRAASVASMAGVELPVEARKRYTYIFDAERPLR